MKTFLSNFDDDHPVGASTAPLSHGNHKKLLF